MTERQLRDYRIADGHLSDFIAAWTAGVLPLRQRAGFRVEAWSVPAESRFLWIVAHDGTGGRARLIARLPFGDRWNVTLSLSPSRG